MSYSFLFKFILIGDTGISIVKLSKGVGKSCLLL